MKLVDDCRLKFRSREVLGVTVISCSSVVYPRYETDKMYVPDDMSVSAKYPEASVSVPMVLAWMDT